MPLASMSSYMPKDGHLNVDTSIPDHYLPGVWVTKWVDFTSKYGLGYLLSNGSVGIYFNDATKIILDNKGSTFEYMERTKVVGELVHRQRFPVGDYPIELRKKVILLEHFSKYLLSQRRRGDNEVSPTGEDLRGTGRACKKVDMDYIRKWHRLPHAIIFRFENNVIQVQFFDRTQLILSSDTAHLIYVNKDGSREYQRTEVVLESDSAPLRKMKKRLLYASEIQDFVKTKGTIMKSIASSSTTGAMSVRDF